MNINGRLALAMTLAITASLVSTSAKAQTAPIQDPNSTDIYRESTIPNPQLIRKILIIQPGGIYEGKDDFHDSHPNLPKFGEAKPGTPFVNFKKPDPGFDVINPAYKIRPSAVEKFRTIGR